MDEEKKILQAILAWGIVITVLDFLFRFSYFKTLSLLDFTCYVFSIFFELSAIVVILATFLKTALRKYIFFLSYVICILGSYAFYSYFKTLPAVHTFTYMFREPVEFFTFAFGDGNYLYLFFAAAISVIIWFPLSPFIKKTGVPSRNALRAARINLCVTAALLLPGIAVKDNRALPVTNGLFSFVIGGFTWGKDGFDSHGLMKRNVSFDNSPAKLKPELNLLVIVNEGLSAAYYPASGCSLNTAPGVMDFLRKNRDNVFIFPRAFSNATVTKVSVSSFMAGLYPIRGKSALKNSPLFFEVLKNRCASYKTCLVTSWSYKQSNWVSYFSSPYLDYFKYLENTGAKKLTSLSADDSLIAGHFSDFLDRLGKDDKFCSILHYANTHYPYYSKPSCRVFHGPNPLLDDYLNALVTLDRNINPVIEILGKRSLLENTVILFTADHSESFGEIKDRFGHLGKFSFYTTNIPFWIYIPEKVLINHPKFRTALKENLSKNISNCDIFPTVLGFYGIAVVAGKGSGSSLLTGIESGRDIFIFNWPEENVLDNKTYVGIIRDNVYFEAEREGNSLQYFRYDFGDTRQKMNLWGKYPDEDRKFLSSLRKENLQMFMKSR
jgi:glucan phosphoethanolaminetransferase (alkaline phosphatase superfamily)